MPNWPDLLQTDILTDLGKDCETIRELADAVASKIGENVTTDALFNAHKRHRGRLKLKTSLTKYLRSADREPLVKPEDIVYRLTKERREEIASAERFVITSAMNNVPLDRNVWQSLQGYAGYHKACILIVPSRYKNPTSKEEAQKSKRNAWWPEDIEPYMTDDFVELHEHLWLMAHVRIAATARNPLSGVEAISKGASAIIGHSQLAMKMVPTPQHHLPKIMYTTGSISQCDYSDTRAGALGAFHHINGALVVERDGTRFHVRNLVHDDKAGFYDLDYYYNAKGRTKSTGALALVTGDEHAIFADPECKHATYLAKDSIVKVLKPQKIVRHDVFDAYSISHHSRKDPVSQYGKHKHGYHTIQQELEATLRHIEETTPEGSENIIVASNHHDHILRWMKEVHAPREEPWNVDVWLDLWRALSNTVEFRENGIAHADPLALWLNGRLTKPTKFLSRDDDTTISNILIGMHGDRGSNGSRGTINQFARLGVKTVSAHSHTPGIKQGAWVVGTSSYLRLEYNSGASSWAHAHCAIHPNGKRQMIFIIDGHWRKVEKKNKPKSKKKKI